MAVHIEDPDVSRIELERPFELRLRLGPLTGGTLDPTAVEITGGTFGGTGTVIADTLAISDGAILDVGGPRSGLLTIQGGFTQNDGAIDFLIDSNGASRLEFDSADGVSITDAAIMFDFTDAAAETAFIDSGLFDLDRFFLDDGGLTGGRWRLKRRVDPFLAAGSVRHAISRQHRKPGRLPLCLLGRCTSRTDVRIERSTCRL
jgi:hypothetical protein